MELVDAYFPDIIEDDDSEDDGATPRLIARSGRFAYALPSTFFAEQLRAANYKDIHHQTIIGDQFNYDHYAR